MYRLGKTHYIHPFPDDRLQSRALGPLSFAGRGVEMDRQSSPDRRPRLTQQLRPAGFGNVELQKTMKGAVHQRLHHLHEGEGGGRDPHEGEGGGREGRGGKRGRQAGPPFGGLLDERAVLARGSGLDLVRVEGEGAGEVEARE